MERDVESDSQLFWNEDEKAEYAGVFTHPNVIREIMTPVEGIAIEAGGTIKETVETTLDPTWNLENLYLVALVHRDGKLGGKRMHVFNTAEGTITEATGIVSPLGETEEGAGAIYNIAGQRLQKMQKGINIVNGKKVLK